MDAHLSMSYVRELAKKVYWNLKNRIWYPDYYICDNIWLQLGQVLY